MMLAATPSALDTDICIDILNQQPDAVAWLQQQLAVSLPQMPGMVALELLQGAHDRREVRSVQRFIAQFVIIWPTEEDGRAAMELVAQYGPSHHLGLADALIAATALRSNAVLYTFNTKHFSAVPGLAAQAPYPK